MAIIGVYYAGDGWQDLQRRYADNSYGRSIWALVGRAQTFLLTSLQLFGLEVPEHYRRSSIDHRVYQLAVDHLFAYWRWRELGGHQLQLFPEDEDTLLQKWDCFCDQWAESHVAPQSHFTKALVLAFVFQNKDIGSKAEHYLNQYVFWVIDMPSWSIKRENFNFYQYMTALRSQAMQYEAYLDYHMKKLLRQHLPAEPLPDGPWELCDGHGNLILVKA